MTKSAEVFNGSLKRGVTRFKVCRVQSFSFCYKHLEPPGTAYDCISVCQKCPNPTPPQSLGISSLLPTPPSIFTQSSSVALQKLSSQFSATYLSFDPTIMASLSQSLSEASLGLRDIDFDAVCALCSGVLTKRGSLFRSQ